MAEPTPPAIETKTNPNAIPVSPSKGPRDITAAASGDPPARAQEFSLPAGYYMCPHCGRPIEVIQENCRIFICGVDARTHVNVNPHDEKGALKMLAEGRLIGCGKQFRLEKETGRMVPCTGM